MDVPRIAVVGSGYVGTVVAACLAFLGREVVCLEADDARLATLRTGRAPFYESDVDPLLRDGLDNRRLRFTDDVADAVNSADVIFLCVGTPGGSDGHADVSAVAGAARAIATAADGPKVLVTKSTVPIGSGHWLQTILEESVLNSTHREPSFSIVSNPEFLRQGSAVHDYLHPDRVVLGSDDADALEQLAEVYEPILEQRFDGGTPERRPPLVRTDLTTAETVKYASNAFLALKISFANEIAAICELIGADVSDVSYALGLDPRIGAQFLQAGAGWGGSCFGKDINELVATAAEHGYEARLLQAAIDVNRSQRHLVVSKLRRGLRGLRGRRIGMLGLAFKPGTDDLRDAPAVDVAAVLLGAGALVVAHDPVVKAVPSLDDLRVVGDPYDVVERADAVVLMTDWPSYRDLDLDIMRARMRGSLFLDGRNVIEPGKARAAGLAYEGIGRRTSPGSCP